MKKSFASTVTYAILLPIGLSLHVHAYATQNNTNTQPMAVTTRGLSVQLDKDGRIAGVVLSDRRYVVGGESRLGECNQAGMTRAVSLNDGFSFTRDVGDSLGHCCTIVDRFTPEADCVRWEIEIAQGRHPQKSPWTTSINIGLRWMEPNKVRFWTAWQDPVHSRTGEFSHTPGPWNDPLAPQPFVQRLYSFGQGALDHEPDGMSFEKGTVITIPLASVLLRDCDTGLSLVQSPCDTILDMTLATDANGQMLFSHENHRLGTTHPVRLTYYLVPHQADWRGGLEWLVRHFPQYFDPPNPRADGMAGCGAYSGYEQPVDPERLKKMAFRVNWKVSADYAFMGMFLPPLASPDDRWDRTKDDAADVNKPLWTSDRRLNDYARWMRENGFYLLSYFNVTEYGRNMRDLDVSAARAADPQLWMDAAAYLKVHMPKAPTVPRIVAWQEGWSVDPGDAGYQSHILDQAERHIRMIPDAAGICIDRNDYLRQYNLNGNDGVSWRGQPARALVESWKSLLGRLGPLMHDHDKVIFANTQHPRIDLVRHLDGIYAEYGNHPTVANGTALLGLRKPVLAWTTNNDPLSDAFFHRHLHLGVYPTAPYFGNNHCIEPSADRDRWFFDYGPLLDAMRGKKWVLRPHCVEVKLAAAKCNLFAVPGGYVLPVTFAGKAKSVDVILRGLKCLSCTTRVDALHPGVKEPVNLRLRRQGSDTIVTVPLHRECAMVRVMNEADANRQE